MSDKILFAADDLDKYGKIVESLKNHGFPHIITMTSGEGVLHYIRNATPDFIILDVSLPILDGFQICKILKSAEFKHFHNIPVLLLSETCKNLISSQLAKSVGAYGILHAPFTVDDLLLLIYNKLHPEKITIKRPKELKYKAKVLIADDDPDILRILGYCIGAEGYEVFNAMDGEETIRTITAEKPHILFLDYDMPKINGQEVLKRIKYILPETVIIMMTAHGSEVTAIEFMKGGAYDYIIKPFDINIIPGICEDALKKYNLNQMQKGFHEVESKLYSMVEGMIDGVVLTDINGKIRLINRAGKGMLTYLDIEKNGDVLVRINNISLDEIHHNIFHKKQQYVSLEINTNGHEEKYFVINASPVNGLTGENLGIVIVLRDVTREYQLQNQIVKSERLYAVSNLVAGAAHELNNPLAGIQLCTELAMNELSTNEKARKYLIRIQKETEQIQGVIKSLLTFTGNYTLSKEQININEIIKEIIKQKAYQYEYANIKILTILDESLPPVFADKYQIRRVILNITENAYTSMEGTDKGGRLTIQTTACKDLVKIVVSDTGPGIPKQNLSRIFEPFFTTKNIKQIKGTGLGLSIAHSIVQQHNGKIYARSEEGKGATFVIELPIK